MTTTYDKPFKTLDEQIQLLKNKGLIILDNDFAKMALSTVSYYDLINGYQECMMANNVFKPNISINYLYLLHQFDKNFQNIIFKNSILIENLFKNKLSYTLAKNFGVSIEEYLNPTLYIPKYKVLNFYKLREDFYKVYMKRDSKDNCYKQTKPEQYIPQPTSYYAYHHNHIPPWIIMRNISFGNAIDLYRLLKTPCKIELTNDLISADISIPEKIDFLTAALSLIRDFRNKVAHNLKFVTYTSQKYRLPTKPTHHIIKNRSIFSGINNLNDIYACTVAIMILLDARELKAAFMDDLYFYLSVQSKTNKKEAEIKSALFKDYSLITKLPNDFLDRLSLLIKQPPIK